MKRTLSYLILILGFLALNLGDSYALGEKQNLDKDKLNKIHEHLTDRIKTGSIAGAVVLVAQDGKIVHYEAMGSADMEKGKPMTKDAVFRLASMSKPITGTAVLMLIEQGKISLNDPLSKYIPQFKNLKVAVAKSSPLVMVPAYREVTIKDLLTHSSGIGQGDAGNSEINKIKKGLHETLANYIPKLAGAPLDFQPGTQTGYSALAGFDILGRVVEIVSGEPLDQFLSKHLFQPLEMKNTGFASFGKSRWEKLPVMYKRTEKGMIRDTKEQNVFLDSTYFSGAAGLTGTMEDYFHFVQMLADGGTYKGKRIIGPEMIAQMSGPQLPDTIKGFYPGQIWGLSVRVVTADKGSAAPLTKGCYGWSGAWGTHFWIDPVHKIVALYMTNVSNIGGAGADTARELERDVMGALKEEKN